MISPLHFAANPPRTVLRLVLVAALLALMACDQGGGDQGQPGAGGSPDQTPAAQNPMETGTASPTDTPAGTPTMVPTPITVQGQQIQYHGQVSVVGKKSVTIDLYDNYFEPSVLVGSPGQTLTVNLLNEGEIAHTFTMKQQDIDKVLRSGQSMQVRVTFPESNREDFICRFHLSVGMAGILVVTG